MGTTPRGLPYPESSDLVSQGASAIEDLAEATDTELGEVTTAAVTQAVEEATTQANAYTDTTTAGIQDAAVTQAVEEATTQANAYTDTTTAGIQDAAVTQANAYTDAAVAGITPGDTVETAAVGDPIRGYGTDANGQVTITPTPPAEGTWTPVTIIATPITTETKRYVPYLRRVNATTGSADFIVYNNDELAASTTVFFSWIALFARVEE